MKPGRITIHCSATENGKECLAETIKEWHLARGFNDIGYHMVIQPDGSVERGRGLNVVGAHVEGDNEDDGKVNVGICLIGTDKFTQYQFYSLRYKLDSLFMLYDLQEKDIYGHYEFDSAKKQGKTCPNMRTSQIVAWYAKQDFSAIREYLHKSKGPPVSPLAYYP